MTCDEAIRRLAELELGDLDAEPAREVESHLRACAACRAMRSRTARVTAALRAAVPASPSTERRLAAVAAMVRLTPPAARRAPLLPFAAAAAFLLALGAGLFLRTVPVAFTVASVEGRVDRLDRRSGTWAPLAAGDEVRAGDRLVTQAGGAARLRAPGTELDLGPETSVDVTGRSQVALDRGRLEASRDGSAGFLRITDTADNRADLREGALTATLREARALVAGSEERRDGGAQLPAAKVHAVRRLTVRVTRGEADLGGSHEQRLRARAGQEGTFDFGGQPSAAPAGAKER